MSEPSDPSSLQDLNRRIASLRAERDEGKQKQDRFDDGGATASGLGMASRIAIEMVVSLVVCTAIGWSLDHLFDSGPWGMLIGLVLGAAAGMNNAVRAALKFDADAQRRLREGKDGGDDGTGTGNGKN